MDRKKNVQNNNQNRQISSTGAVPKSGSKRETPRDVVSRVVAPIVRETHHNNLASYNMLLDWQQNHYPDQHSSDHSHQRERFNRDLPSSAENTVFEQVVNGGSLPHEQQNWLQVRPQIRQRNQAQAGSNSSHNMSNTNGLQQPQPHHSSSNTAIVLPTTPNMHPLTNGDLIINSNNSSDVFISQRHQDRATQVLPLMNNNRAEGEDRLNNGQAFVNTSTNLPSGCDDSSIVESNDLNAPMSNSDNTDDSIKCMEMQLRMDISNRKLQVLQNQHSQLLLIQESAKLQLNKLKRLKQMEQQQLSNQEQSERINQPAQLLPNQTNKVFSVQSQLQLFDNSNRPDRNSATNQTDFSFQPINPMTYSLQNNENLMNSKENHIYNRENTNYNCYSDNRVNNHSDNKTKPNGNSSVYSEDTTLGNNHSISGSANENPGDFSIVEDGLSDISRRLQAVDAIIETCSEIEGSENLAFMPAQADFEEKLRELQNKKQQMDSLVADLQQLNKQATRDAELRATFNAGNESGIYDAESDTLGAPVTSAPVSRINATNTEDSSSSVGNEVAQINAMKVQLARLKDMMDTMKYIEARTGGSEDSVRSSSPRSSLCDHQSASTIETTNYAESWASSTMKPNNVDNMSQVPYKVLLSDNENLNSVSNWLDSDGGGGDRSSKYSELTSLINNPTLNGISLETFQSLTQELREQANAVSAERERLVQAHNQILSGTARSTSMSSTNSYGNRPEKCVNQQVPSRQLHKSQSSLSHEPGPKEKQQQMLKVQLEAKKRELEELMKKDRNLSSLLNQTSNASSNGSKQDTQPETNSSPWSNDQRFPNKSTSRKTSGQSTSLSEAESRRVNRQSREGSESTVVTSLPDIDASSNTDFPPQNIPVRNASRHSNNMTPPIPPPMPDISFGKDSQDSSNFTSPNSQNNQNDPQSQFNSKPRWAQQLQAQFDMCFNRCHNLAMTSANNQGVTNQSQMTNANPSMLPPYLQPPISGYSNPLMPHASDLGLYYQLLNSSTALPPPTGLGNNFNPYCPCNNALWQIVWMQQREIANFGRAVCSLQEHLLQLTSKQLPQQSPDITFNQRGHSSAHISAVAPSPQSINNLPSQQIQHQQQLHQVKLPPSNIYQNNTTNQVSNQNSACPSSSTQHMQQVFENESVFTRSTPNLTNGNNLSSDQGINLSTINFVTPSVDNLQYVHNNTTSQVLGMAPQNVNLQNHGQIYHNGEMCMGSVPNSANGHITLNNQVPPGNRANNYWDNFRSYSRQNLLSGNSKSAKESATSVTCQSVLSPLVTRSHNTLRTVPSTCQVTLPKQNIQISSDLQLNNIIQDQTAVSDVNVLQRQLQTNIRNQYLEIQPDVLNINQNIINPQGSSSIVNSSQQDGACGNISSNIQAGSSINYPEIIQTHSSFADIGQQNLKTNLPIKTTGTNKKKSKISVVHSVNNETENIQQNYSEAKHDPNLLSNENLSTQAKSVIKPFDQLREAVYGEVTALIAQNESRPQYLLQLFQNLRQVACDPLRQQALDEIQNLVAMESSSVSTNAPSNNSAKPSTSSSANNTSTKTPSKKSGKYTGAVKKGNISVRKEDREPVSQVSHIEETSSTTESNDQRCSSTTDAEQCNNQISNGNNTNEVFDNAFLEKFNANCIDVSCSEQYSSPFLTSKPENNIEVSKSSRFPENLLLSINNIQLPEANNSDFSLLANSSHATNNNIDSANQIGVTGPKNESQNLYRTNNLTDNAMPRNEDLAEADQIRTSGTHNDATTSTQPFSVDSPHNKRNMPESDMRTGDGPTQSALAGSSRNTYDNEINVAPLPLPDLARVGPGGDHDVTESIRPVSTSGFDHGLDRVPTRLSNGPWSPESSANDSNHDTSIHSSNAEE